MNNARKFRWFSLSIVVLLLVAFSLQTLAGGAAEAKNQVGATYQASQIDGAIGDAVVSPSEMVLEDGKLVMDKTISATNTENVFDITLSVKTKDEITNNLLAPDAAVVLVIDTSTSMNEKLGGEDRLTAAKEAAQQFINDFAAPAEADSNVIRKIAVVEFYKDAHTLLEWTDAEDLNTSSSTDYTSVIRNLNCNNHSGTNIEGGLLLANNLLRNHNNALNGIENTSVILLSDGGANACVVSNEEVASYRRNFGNGDITTYNQSDYTVRNYTGYYNNANYHFHHGGAMDAAAALPEGVKLNTVYSGNANDVLTVHDSAANGKLIQTGCKYCDAANAYFQNNRNADTKVTEFLSDISDRYLTVANSSELAQEFQAISSEIEIHTQAWRAFDPVINVDFVSFAEAYNAGEVALENGQVNWNLLKAEPVFKDGSYHYAVTYRVKLDTLKNGYVAGQNYVTNGATELDYYFKPSQGEQSGIEKAYFNVPSVFGYAGDLTFNKVDNKGNALAGATFTLTANADPSWTRTATSDGEGKVSFAGVPSGQTYTLTETAFPDGYAGAGTSYGVSVAYGEVTVNGKDPSAFEVVNTLLVNDITGQKVWDDSDNAEGFRPESITVNLLKNGKVVDSRIVNAAGNWAFAFNDLPARENGAAVVYTVEEIIPAGYTAAYTSTNEGIIITNSRVVETVDIPVTKIWADGNDQDGKRPETITINLYANGDLAASQTISAADNWQYTFRNMQKYANGEEIVYTISETGVDTNVYTVSYDQAAHTVTNTYVPETTEVSGQKIWNDNNNQDGIRPESVTVNLLKNGQVVDSVEVSAATNWAYEFDNLPKYEAGQPISYSVSEDTVAGYTADIAADGTITNTHVPEETSVSVTKVWSDSDDQAGFRPESVTIYLKANGQVVDSQVVTGELNWTYTFANLPKYADGQEISYTVAEDAVARYTVSITGSAAAGYTVTNTHAPETVNVTGIKIWNDAQNQDGKRPETITVNLFKNDVKIDSMEVSADTDWAYAFNNLPKFENGIENRYSVTEDAVAGYTTTIIDGTITNTYAPEKVTVSGTKIWADDSDRDGIRPATVIVELYADGVKVDETQVGGTGNTWSYNFRELPKYNNGVEILYTVQEAAVDGYTTTYNGYHITNTHTPATVEVSGSKTWVDNNDQDGIRPEKITVNLSNGIAVIASQEVSAATNWEYSFENLPKYSGGNEINYSVIEVVPAGYTASYNGNDITNTHVPAETEVSVNKVWDDAANQDGKRPVSVTVILKADGVEADRVVLNAANGWEHTFTELAVNNAGKAILYTVEEAEVADYTAVITGNAANGFTVTNSHTPETVTVAGTKTWVDGNDQDGIRPEYITINLYVGDNLIDTTVANAGNDWTYEFLGLPKYTGGEEVVYTIREEAVAGYAATYAGFDITNTHTPETTTVSGMKTWNDNNDQDGTRPDSIEVVLKKNGTQIDSKTVTAAEGWAYSFTNLPVYEAGEAVTYTIEETPLDPALGYETTYDGFNIINSRDPETTAIAGTKTWNDNNDQDGIRPDSIVVILMADGQETARQTVTAEDDWTYEFTEMPVYAMGRAIVYTIAEEAVEGYTATYNGNNITNTHVPATVNVQGEKIWEDADNQDGIRPSQITVVLYADGQEVDSALVTAENNWEYSFNNLPKKNAGVNIVYSVEEVLAANSGYTAINSATSYDITNTHIPAEITVSGQKSWNDAEDQDGIRPDSITVILYANGEVKAATTATAETNWAYEFANLPKYEVGQVGQEVVYTVEEVAVAGYTAVYDGFNITNTHTPETTAVEGVKVWVDAQNQDGVRPESITVILKANGTEAARTTTDEANAWAFAFTELPKYEAGEAILYTVEEAEVGNGYEVSYDGFHITNTRNPELTSVVGTKTWDDADNQDGIRPETILVTLLADGEAIDQMLVGEEENWTYRFTDLPKFENGEEILYTVEEAAVEGYETVYDGFDIMNTHTPETIVVEGSKVWDDADNQDGIRPASVTIILLANGEAVATQEVTAETDWAFTFEELPKFAAGEAILYTVEEVAVEGYETVIDGFVVTNVHETETTEVAVTKMWSDEDNLFKTRPDSITVRLWANGEETGQFLTLTAEDGWAGSFTGLAAYAGGEEVVYTVTEDAVFFYLTTITGNAEEGFVILNYTEDDVLGDTDGPSTGDTTNPNLWFVTCILAVTAMLGLGMTRKKFED